MKARDRLNWFFDNVTTELGQEFAAKDPLHFVDSKPYPERIKEAQEKTGETEALVVMQGQVKNIAMVACAFEFDFMAGSMGTVVGDRFVQAAEKAIKDKQPLICFAASGGARMQEGMLSLMQMARTSAAIQKMKDAHLPYIVVLTHPVYGGVTASLAMLGDVHIAEPKAMIGFAGKRVIEQTVREKLEEPFQRAEFLLDHGVIDQIVHRHALRDTVYRIVAKTDEFALNNQTAPLNTDDLKTWLNYWSHVHVTGIDLGLERVIPVAEQLGVINPKAKVITVAGTNGKGSTTTTLAAILNAQGLNVGLYQSPHIYRFNERVKLAGQEVDDQTLIDAFVAVDQARRICDLSLSFFEATTLAAFVIFKQKQCDVWVLEVGLGGRLDVVNVIDPDVGCDYQYWLRPYRLAWRYD